MGYLLLGCPRSGTTLLGSLVKHLKPSYFINEPFAMRIPWVLQEDTVPSDRARRRLLCTCGGCYVCDLRTEVASGRMSFKETSLFEYLPILRDSFGVSKVVYLERQLEDVSSSYKTHGLWDKWSLDQREFAKRHPGLDSGYEYGKAVTLAKRGYWAEHRQLFDHLEISYEGLVADPTATLDSIAQFVGLEPTSMLRKLIDQKFSLEQKPGVYGTFH